jgi:hypothetical protein
MVNSVDQLWDPVIVNVRSVRFNIIFFFSRTVVRELDLRNSVE